MRFTSLAASAALAVAGCAMPRFGGPPPATPGGAAPSGPAAQGAARTWDEYRLRAARRIVQTSPGETFEGELPEPLRSIPVLQVHLNRDGTVRRIEVLRTPRNTPQTVETATRAIRRAAPFEPVGHLPQPWQFNETFLYNDDLKFQLRTLVEAP